MKFLITGAGGQLGSEWAKFLAAAEGHKAIALTSSEMDITDPECVMSMLEAKRPDVVVNCAAYTAVDQAESEPEAAFRANRDGVRHLSDACAENDIMLVHYSTDYVFPGKAEDRSKYPKGYPETANRAPVNRYGDSKLAGEQELEKSEAKWLLVRVSWLCSASGTNFVNTMIRLGNEREELSVVDDQIGSPSFTFDVVDKTMTLLEKERTGTFHVSCTGVVSWADFAEEIFEQLNMDTGVIRVTTAEYPTAAVRPAFSLLATEKIRSEGLIPLQWKDGLRKLLELKKETYED
ncbi:dTDP-4-dehydrorhamnose reductase [Rhodohalobacter mucosus]|uniref:dTDP-4-dehydrorhamnose reductase n=1 Tax=Rhodohalobacter mucosus TaxID=2079485 RepID=A0A316U3M6_9BACT|nr:dTDP-4-dehydrorhamnose reductase [Rhodohalobacter mucosus]PWN08066.1 dTDP-4-dehydrorhamnose reductase [Rhodohalobacter mucosus]